MATVTTVTPTVTTRPHIPGSPGDRSLAGEVDLATRESWSYVSSFVVGGLELTYNSGGPTVDIAQGRIARARPDADPSQELITVGAVSGVSLASSSTNYIYFKSDNDIEVRDADNPPSADALLLGTVDTSAGEVTEAVRGRSPISQFAGAGGFSSILSVVATGTLSVSSSGADTANTGVSVSDAGGDPLLLAYGWDTSTTNSLEFEVTDDDNQTGNSVSVQLSSGNQNSSYVVRVTNEEQESVDVSWALLRVSI